MKNLKLIDSKKSQIEDVYKLIFEDDDVLEVSYIRKGDGKDILCVPSQTSCNLKCVFCHLTGLGIKAKNLNSERIINLIEASLKYQLPANKTLLISYMGAGDGLMNLDGVLGSALHMRDHSSFEDIRNQYNTIRFAISTIIPNEIKFNQFKKSIKQHKLDFKLHWSLHSLDSVSRKNLMPAALNIPDALKMIDNYIEETGNPVEIHYTLMDEINDREEDLNNFIKYVSKKPTIKFLKFAEKKNEPLMRGSKRVNWFKSELEKNGFKVEVYSPPGSDIGSSCGQFLLDQYVK